MTDAVLFEHIVLVQVSDGGSVLAWQTFVAPFDGRAYNGQGGGYSGGREWTMSNALDAYVNGTLLASSVVINNNGGPNATGMFTQRAAVGVRYKMPATGHIRVWFDVDALWTTYRLLASAFGFSKAIFIQATNFTVSVNGHRMLRLRPVTSHQRGAPRRSTAARPAVSFAAR